MFAPVHRLLRSPKRLGWLLLAVVSSALILLMPLSAQSAAPAPRFVEIAETSGDVTFQGAPVSVGDRLPATASNGLQTGTNGRARLIIDDTIGSVEVEPESELNVSGLNTLESGGKTTELLLAKGRARVRVRRFNNPDSRFDVRTPAGNAGVRGTEFTLYVLPDGETHMSVLDGLVQFSGIDPEEIIDCLPGTGWIAPAQAGPILGGQIFGDLDLRFELLADRQQVRVTASTNPTNTARLNGNPVPVNRQGQIDQVVPLPGDRRLQLVIRDLFNRELTYELLVQP
ncbi:MAG: FecR domain-containing protein [Spirulinaceae cyanobacterium RM2_2_10]|nr:FecR domain-containing protein [Spirulinaceae cyanobacterium SM2_1_0]NJO20817.1 FecR domain-containing protein [Spirulinaceae cyanobacterium RM2_2_10]